MKNKKLLSLLLAFAIAVTLLAGCSGRKEEEPEVSEDSSISISASQPEVAVSGEKVPELTALVAEKKGLNADSIGWLQVPNTEIDDVVLVNFNDNQYYLRRNFELQYDFNGVYYADRRSTFGTGTRDELGMNTCIYGHAMTDNPENGNYPIKFGPLHNFRDEKFAKETPYIFFSTAEEDMAFEVFAVFFADSNNLSYNRNDLAASEFYRMVNEDVRARSIYDYDVEVKEGDKILTLSTCIYHLPNGYQTGYPKTFYRFAIMAKLVDKDAPLRAEAAFTINEDFVLDPDTYPK